MATPRRDPLDLLLPLILTTFVALYVVGLLAEVEPEVALLRAGLAGTLLAVLGRLAVGLLDGAPARAPRAARPAADTANDETSAPAGGTAPAPTPDAHPGGRE